MNADPKLGIALRESRQTRGIPSERENQIRRASLSIYRRLGAIEGWRYAGEVVQQCYQSAMVASSTCHLLGWIADEVNSVVSPPVVNLGVTHISQDRVVVPCAALVGIRE